MFLDLDSRLINSAQPTSFTDPSQPAPGQTPLMIQILDYDGLSLSIELGGGLKMERAKGIRDAHVLAGQPLRLSVVDCRSLTSCVTETAMLSLDCIEVAA